MKLCSIAGVMHLLFNFCMYMSLYILQNRWGTLHTAARYGHVPVVDTLVNLGANVNAVSMVSSRIYVIHTYILEIMHNIFQENWTPLLTAARNDHVAVIDTLIQSGADVDGGNLVCWQQFHVNGCICVYMRI